MKKTKWLAGCVLVLLVAGVVNSIFGLIEAPSIPGGHAMKGIDRSLTSPWWEAREDNPMQNLPESDPSGLLAAINDYDNSGSVPSDLPQLLQAYRSLNRSKYSENPWYLFFEGVGCLMLNDNQGFETISERLFSMETVTSDMLNWMGMWIKGDEVHDYEWMYYERSIRRYVLEGASMDENSTLLHTPFFIPMRSLERLLEEGKSGVALQRLNALIKMNPRMENMYWIYMQANRYFTNEGMETLAPIFKKLAARKFRGSISFDPQTIVKGDYYLTAMAVTLFMFLVYMVALRFKYHGAAWDARQRNDGARKAGRRRYFSWRKSPYYYLKPGEFVFLLAMAGLFLVLSSNARCVLLSIGRGASTPKNFASGRFVLPESQQALANLKIDYGDTPEFKRFYAYCLAKAGDYDAARTELERTLDENNNDVPALVNLAVIEYREGNNLRAGRLIGRAAGLDPSGLEVVHNYRVITGQEKEFPEWFQRLKASEDLETTARIVCDNFDAVWPNTMAVLNGGSSDTLFMSDRGRFLHLWTTQPLTLRSRIISTLEVVRLFVAKNPVRYFGSTVQKWIWIISCLVVGYFCVLFLKGAGHSEDSNPSRCPDCGKDFGGSPTKDIPVGLSSGGGSGLLCRECAGNARYDDVGFLAGKSRRLLMRWVPFAGAFREGRFVTATVTLVLFLYCFVSFVFANTSVLGVYGATGYLSAIAIWRGALFPVTESLSTHHAAIYSAILASGMAVSILLSLAVGRPPQQGRGVYPAPSLKRQ